MKVSKKANIGGDWAKIGEHIKDGDRVKIMDAGQKVPGDFGVRDVFRIMTIRKEELNLSLNQTSMNNLIDGWGDETESWAGKVAKIFVVRQMVGDGLKNVAYVAPEDWTMDVDGKFVNPNKVEKERPTEEIDLDSIPF